MGSSSRRVLNQSTHSNVANSTCAAPIITPPVRSRSSWLEPVFVMKTAENRRGDDALAVANAVAGLHRREGGDIRNAGAEARVRTPAVVLRDALPETRRT